jgi:hypothetical protein
MSTSFWPAKFYGEPNPEMEKILISIVSNFLSQYPLTKDDVAKRTSRAITLAIRAARERTGVAEFLQDRLQLQRYLARLAIQLARKELPDFSALLRPVLNQLRPSDRRLLVWFYEHLLDEHEIGYVLAISSSRAFQLLVEAKARLSAFLDRENLDIVPGWRP